MKENFFLDKPSKNQQQLKIRNSFVNPLELFFFWSLMKKEDSIQDKLFTIFIEIFVHFDLSSKQLCKFKKC